MKGRAIGAAAMLPCVGEGDGAGGIERQGRKIVPVPLECV